MTSGIPRRGFYKNFLWYAISYFESFFDPIRELRDEFIFKNAFDHVEKQAKTANCVWNVNI